MSRLHELCRRAGVTEKEWEALSLWDPGIRGYRSVALALGISKTAAEDRILRAKRKIAAHEEIEL